MSTHSLQFDLYDHSFCEMNIYGKAPEYINSISSLFLCFFGLFGIIVHSKMHDVKMIYTAMVFNGISSFMYHFTNQLGWGLLDRFSMIMIVIPCYTIAIKILEVFNLHIYFYDVLRFLVTFYLTYLLTMIGLHEEDQFNNLFAVFLFNLLIFVSFIHFYNNRFQIPKIIIYYTWYGILLIAGAGSFWILTEKFCHSFWFIKYLFGHTFWHFGVALGGYLVSFISIYLFDRINFKGIKYFYRIPYLEFN